MSDGSAARIAVLVFPGTNCELDVEWALHHLGAAPELVFHDTGKIDEFDGAVIAGGFAHGDYLRPGAIARFSPVMSALCEFAETGRPVVGICNGFQVLCESGLLPGALQKNAGLEFICRPVDLVVEAEETAITRGSKKGKVLGSIPINHFEGNFTADAATIESLESDGRVVLRYCDSEGRVGPASNPNGSVNSIAGICNEAGNVVGLMPHPERAVEAITGSESGRPLLESLIEYAVEARSKQMASAVSGPDD